MKKNYNCGVDAGCVCLIPIEFAESWGYGSHLADRISLVHVIPKTGSYHATISIGPDQDDAVSGAVYSDKGLILGDICYIFHDRWEELLKSTNYLTSLPSGCLVLTTGFDGLWKVTLNLSNIVTA